MYCALESLENSFLLINWYTGRQAAEQHKHWHPRDSSDSLMIRPAGAFFGSFAGEEAETMRQETDEQKQPIEQEEEQEQDEDLTQE